MKLIIHAITLILFLSSIQSSYAHGQNGTIRKLKKEITRIDELIKKMKKEYKPVTGFWYCSAKCGYYENGMFYIGKTLSAKGNNPADPFQKMANKCYDSHNTSSYLVHSKDDAATMKNSCIKD